MLKFILSLATGIVASSIKSIAYLAAFLITVSFLPLNEINIQDPGLSTLKPLAGPLAGNNRLSEAQLLFSGEFTGPETLVPHQGYLYFGVSSGDILRVPVNTSGNVADVEQFAHIKSNGRCKYTGLWDQKSCGRPLGMQFDSTGDNLYVLDAYSGIKKINFKNRLVSTVLDVTGRQIAGRKIIFLDDFVMKETPKGKIFFITDASAVYEVDSVVWSTFTHESTGRVLSFNQATGDINVIVKDLSFANGITLTDDKNFLLVNELNARRVLKISVHDPQVPSKVTTFVDNLPGFPDNIRRSSRPSETYWIALYETYSVDHSNMNHKVLAHHQYLIPNLVRLALNLAQFSRTLEPYLSSLIPLKQITYYLETGVIFQMLTADKSIGGAIEVNSQGEIVRALYSLDHKLSFLSEAREVTLDGNKYLFLGSYFNQFIGKLKIEK